MNDLHKLLYDLLEQRRGQPTEERIVDKSISGSSFEITLDYRDQTVQHYVILADEQTIIIRYEDDDNNIHQDALQTNKQLKTETLTHAEDNGYLTISIDYQGGDNGKRTHRR